MDFEFTVVANEEGSAHHRWANLAATFVNQALATTQKYLEPSKETEKQLEELKLPF